MATASWNLADQLNTDENVDSLFDSLPTQTKALERDEAIRVMDAGGDLNTSTKGSFVPNSDGPMKLAPVLESPREKTATDSALGQAEADLGRNVLETFEAPKIQAAREAKAMPVEEYEEEPEEEYLGRTLHAGARLIADLEYSKGGRTGRNAREVAREKALDTQAIAAVKDELRRTLAGVEYSPEVYDYVALRPGGGIRPAEEITELIRIHKNRGVQILNDEGRETFVPTSNWDDVLKVYDLRSAQQRKLAASGRTGGGGGVEEISKWQNVLEKTLDTEGNVIPDRRGEYEKATSELDRLSGAPTGTTRYFQDTGRILSENTKLSRALANNVSYKGIQKEQLQNKINENIESLIQLAIDRGAAPSQTELKDYIKTGAPFLMNMSGQERVVFPTDKPDVYKLWDPTVKKFGTFDLNPPVKKQDEPESEFSDAGQVGQKLRRAGGGVVRAVKGASTTVGEKISNIPAGVANAGVSIVEAGAGVFNVPLKLPRVSNISESLQKMGLKKYEDGTWGPSN